MTRLKQFFSRKRLYTDMDDEIAFHLEQRVEELVAEGMPREKAEAKARKDFGNVAAVKQTAREAWGWKWIEDLFIDLRFGVRMLNKNRVLTLASESAQTPRSSPCSTVWCCAACLPRILANSFVSGLPPPRSQTTRMGRCSVFTCMKNSAKSKLRFVNSPPGTQVKFSCATSRGLSKGTTLPW
jgi:hypothetical protein